VTFRVLLDRNTLKIGDEVSVDGSLARNGTRGLNARRVASTKTWRTPRRDARRRIEPGRREPVTHSTTTAR
jgi:hypothetical protein